MIIPEINTVCKYKFIAKFGTFDGIYRLTKKSTYNDSIRDEIDFVANLYTPIGLNKDDFENDYPTYKNGIILYLTQMNVASGEEASVLYVPESIIDQVPDPMVQKYYEYALAVKLGYIDSLEDMEWIKQQLEEFARAMTGAQGDVAIYSINGDGTYMLEAEYQQIEDDRKDQITAIVSNYTNLQKQIKLNQELIAKVKYYEDLIINLNTGG